VAEIITGSIKSNIPVPHRARRYSALYILEVGECTDIEVVGSLGLCSLRASINYVQHKLGRRLTTRTVFKDPNDPTVRILRVWRVK
jgi:hypothetical protein